ncbi:DUF2293 domain-containing protein [Mesorhizobium sp. WSM3868]|uniref:DUF2293 domain-containing protein n=1 Tax=Mesorhizobium sp. WSM3868 TaxID=2029405 RepID=UPI000BAF18B0|nr:DUF2293 domain-containing protein [Mesorhizobium sp. WSM3868]PBB39611.1 hypothetical protein CK221_01970 [Mesorhizobium sp. WSM3868]
MSDHNGSTRDTSIAFSFDVVMRHMRINHPGCPKETCHTIANRVSARTWRSLKLGAAVGIELQKLIRHSLTDYDELLRTKMMTRDEARSFVAPHVQEVLGKWRKPGVKLRVARPEG